MCLIRVELKVIFNMQITSDFASYCSNGCKINIQTHTGLNLRRFNRAEESSVLSRPSPEIVKLHALTKLDPNTSKIDGSFSLINYVSVVRKKGRPLSHQLNIKWSSNVTRQFALKL